MILESWLSSIRNRLRQPKLGSSRRRGDNRSHFAAEIRHLEILEDRALLSAFSVVSAGDAGTGSGLSGDIRYCVTQANQPANAGSTITFETALTGNTVTLANGPLVISDAMTITGPGASSLTLSGNNSSRLFDVESGGSLTLQNVTLSGGLAQGTGAAAEGGAIYTSGTLVLNGVTLTNNEALGSNGVNGGNGANAYGGGIYVAAGSVTLTNDTCSSNSAVGGRGAYGSGNDGQGTSNEVEAPGGSGGAGSGGGLYVAGGSVTLTNDALSGNNAVGGNGGTGAGFNKGYTDSGTILLPGGTGNGGAGSGGGLYLAAGSVTLTNNTLSGNQADGGNGAIGLRTAPGNGEISGEVGGSGGAGSGGGLYVATGTLTLANDTLNSNQAGGGSGAAGGNGGGGAYPGDVIAPGTGGSGGAGSGGGSYVAGGIVTLTNDTLANNQAGGGNGGVGGLDNGNGGSGGVGSGGGLYAAAGSITLSNDTLSSNHVAISNGGSVGDPDQNGTIGSNGAAGGGGIDNAAGSSSLQIYDSIIADDTANTAGPDLDGSVTSLGNNLIGNSTGGSGFAASDLLNVNPQLGPLQNNGGPTQTMALLPGSPAINSGDTANAPAYDQRGPGFPRIVNGSIDIGAFEVQATNVAAPIVSSINTTQGPASGGTSVTITGSNLGTASTATVDFGTGHPATIVSDSGSTIVATSPAGTGTVNVTVTTLGGTSTTSSADQFTYLPLTLSPTSLAPDTANQSYSATITASGGSGSYTYALAPGSSLPAGLTLSNSGTVSGTTSTAGSYTFTIVASDTVYAGETGSRQYTLTVNPASTLTLTPASLPNATAGDSYSPVTITASGGSGSYTFALATGSSLPAGLTLSNSGTVSGTTSAAGSFTFTVVASDTVYAGETGSRQYTLTVNPASTLTLAPTSLPNATVGDSYSPVTITASGGSGSYTFALATGSKLPAGLTLTSAGVLSGTPTTSGSPFRFTIVATDKSNSHLTGSWAYTLTVDPAITLSPTTLSVATVGDAVDGTLTAKGGSGADYTFALASGSSLPSGLTLSTAGVITGTPAQSGKYAFTIVATDSIGATASRAYTLTVDPAITLSPTTLPVATVGDAVDDKLTAKGGSGADYTFALASGSSLPSGLKLSSSGVITGKPTRSGKFTFTIVVTDGTGATVTQAYSLTVDG